MCESRTVGSLVAVVEAEEDAAIAADEVAITEYKRKMEDTSDGYQYGGVIEMTFMAEFEVRLPCRACPSASSPAMTGPSPRPLPACRVAGYGRVGLRGSARQRVPTIGRPNVRETGQHQDRPFAEVQG